MSLKTLFGITLSLLLSIILVVVFFINIRTMQTFIQNQVYSTSLDNAYSLGVSLSKLQDTHNKQDVKLLIDAIFDSGYYEYIKYLSIDDKPIYEVSLPLVVKDVPSWFISLIPLHLQEAKIDVTQGWKLKGKLFLKGHSGYAYYELYKSFKELLLVFGIIALVAFISLWFIINTILYSLSKIRKQAYGINQHKFIIEERKTFVNEFALLTQTMNSMVHKVEGIFKSEVATFEEYQHLLYKDEETDLPNKKYFMLKLQEILDDESRNIGYIAIISISGLTKIKKEYGYKHYRKSLEHFLSIIPLELKNNNLLARTSEHEIAVLFHTHNVQEIQNYFDTLQDALQISSKNISSKEKLMCFSIGVAPYFNNDKMSEALSRVDYSLSRSKINGCNIIDIYDVQETEHYLVTRGKNSWKEMFEKIFSQNNILVAMQQVRVEKTDEVYHNEALLRIREENGTLQTAGYYLPMAHALDLVAKFDKSIIDLVISSLEESNDAIAINISRDFILKSVYFLELRSTLASLRDKFPSMLHFESPENEILQDIDAYIEFSEMVHAHKQKFGIDRFSGIHNISYIEKIRPDYIKINVNFILESLQTNSAILNTLNILSQTLGITLIITSVQNQSQYEKLQNIGYIYFQGHYISDTFLKE
jgi:diguanylate cyclase (GGDEF)-like protein